MDGVTGNGLDKRPQLIARIHLPVDHSIPVIYRKVGWNVGAMDGSIFAFTRGEEPMSAYAWWETIEPETIARGHSGLISVIPMHPELWRQLKIGQPLEMTFERLSAQITVPMAEAIP
jgi:hypothetical protein